MVYRAQQFDRSGGFGAFQHVAGIEIEVQVTLVSLGAGQRFAAERAVNRVEL